MPDNYRNPDEDVNVYLSESREMLDKIEPSLIEMGQDEYNPENRETVNMIFRTFHTIKGSSSFFDFKNIVLLTHQAETMLDKIRSGLIDFEPIHSDILCRTLDVLNFIFNQIEKKGTDDGFEYQIEQIIAELANLAGVKPVSEKRKDTDFFVIDRNYILFFESLKKIIKEQSEECRLFLKSSDDQKIYIYLKKIKKVFQDVKEVSGLLGISMIKDITGLLEEFSKLLYDHMEVSEFELNVIIHSFEMLGIIVEELEKSGSGERVDGIIDKYTDNLSEVVNAVKRQIEDVEKERFIDIPVTKDMKQLYVSESLDQLDSIEELLFHYNSKGDIENIKELLRLFHNFKGGCGFMNYADPEKISHKIETFLDKKIRSSEKIEENEYLILIEMVNLLKTYVIGISQNRIDKIDDVEIYTKRIDEMTGLCGASDKVTGYNKDEKIKALKDDSQPGQRMVLRHDIRVNISKLDKLVDLIGELVIAESMVINNPDIEGFDLENFERSATHLDKIIKEIQEVALSVRMIPVSGIFRKMIRVVHDMSRKSKKKVNLRITGEDTEIDKTVAELIADPLVHIVRNSIDHGIESVSERKETGKKETGELLLEAKHEGNEVFIIIRDDGRGLDREKILNLAVEKNLIKSSSDIEEDRINELIFYPGFSTSDEITEISGRGVGLDIVKKNIESINGRVEVFSYKGVGTMFVIRIPLTMAIIEGMLVRVGDAVYAIPLLCIRESVQVTKKEIKKTVDGQEMVKIRDEIIPVIRIHELYNNKPDSINLNEGLLIIVEYNKSAYSLFVDDIIGEQQIVIKSMSKYIDKVKGISGCSILGDGNISLILDIGGLLERSKDFASDLSAITG